MCSTNIYVERIAYPFPGSDMTSASDPRSVPERLPLTPAVFEILLSLAAGERHGYAILQDVEARTAGRVTLHAGTLYRALGRLVDDGLVEETAGPAEPEDERRRYYAVTPLGRAVVGAEADRLERQVRTARAVLGAGPA